MQIARIPSIDRDRIGEHRPENAKDIRMSNCLEFQAKVALSKHLRHLLIYQPTIQNL